MAVYCPVCKTTFVSEILARQHHCPGVPLLQDLMRLLNRPGNVTSEVEALRKRSRMLRVQQLKREAKLRAEKAKMEKEAAELVSSMLRDEAETFNNSTFFGECYMHL